MTAVIGVLVSFAVPLVAAAIVAIYFWSRSRWELKQLNNPERLAENRKAAERRRRVELMRDIQWWGLQEKTSLSLEMVEMLTEQLTELGGPVQSHDSGGSTPPKPIPAPDPAVEYLTLLQQSSNYATATHSKFLIHWTGVQAELVAEKLNFPAAWTVAQQGKLDQAETMTSWLHARLKEHR